MKWFRPPYFSRTLHVLVWLIIFSIPLFVFPDKNYFGLTHSFFVTTTLFHIGIFYLNAYLLYPRLLTRKRWPLYILSLIAVVVITYNLKVLFLRLNEDFIFTNENRRVVFFSLIPILVASILFRLISDRLRFERMEKEARAQRLDAELKFLRSQVSPHFLFNMLTNMVALARTKSDSLEPSLIQLSELLRYMLYDSGEGKISLEKEVEQLQNYISLQQLRFGEDVHIQTSIVNNCNDCSIEPMLLIPFIENAYKHGVGLVKEPFIRIKIHAEAYHLDFTVDNNFNPDNMSKDKVSGIGLTNVRNRLDLLYAGRYTLDMKNEENQFRVHLKLDLL